MARMVRVMEAEGGDDVWINTNIIERLFAHESGEGTEIITNDGNSPYYSPASPSVLAREINGMVDP